MSSWRKSRSLRSCEKAAENVRTPTRNCSPEGLGLSRLSSLLAAELDSMDEEAHASGSLGMSTNVPHTTLFAVREQELGQGVASYGKDLIKNSGTEPDADECVERHRAQVRSLLRRPLRLPLQGPKVAIDPPRKFSQYELADGKGLEDDVVRYRSIRTERTTEGSLAQEQQGPTGQAQGVGGSSSSATQKPSAKSQGKQPEGKGDHVMSIDGPVYPIYKRHRPTRRHAPQNPDAWTQGYYFDRATGTPLPAVASAQEKVIQHDRVQTLHRAQFLGKDQAGATLDPALTPCLGGGLIPPWVQRKIDGLDGQDGREVCHIVSIHASSKRGAVEISESVPDQGQRKRRKEYEKSLDLRKTVLEANHLLARSSSVSRQHAHPEPTLARQTSPRRLTPPTSFPKQMTPPRARHSETRFGLPVLTGLPAPALPQPGSLLRPTQHEKAVRSWDGAKIHDGSEPAGADTVVGPAKLPEHAHRVTKNEQGAHIPVGADGMPLTNREIGDSEQQRQQTSGTRTAAIHKNDLQHAQEITGRARVNVEARTADDMPLANSGLEKPGKSRQLRQEDAGTHKAPVQGNGVGHNSSVIGKTHAAPCAAAAASASAATPSRPPLHTNLLIHQPGLHGHQTVGIHTRTAAEGPGLQHGSSVVDKAHTAQDAVAVPSQIGPNVQSPEAQAGDTAGRHTTTAPNGSGPDRFRRHVLEKARALQDDGDDAAAPSSPKLPVLPQTLEPPAHHQPAPHHHPFSGTEPLPTINLPSAHQQSQKPLRSAVTAPLRVQTKPKNNLMDIHRNLNALTGKEPQLQLPTPSPSPAEAEVRVGTMGMGMGEGVVGTMGGEGIEVRDFALGGGVVRGEGRKE